MGFLQRLLLVCVFAASLILPIDQLRSQEVYGKVSDDIMRFLEAKPDSIIEVAPMATPGDATPGTWIPVANNLFDTMLIQSGVSPCGTDPMTLAGRPGVLELIEESMVLNEGGQRTSMGWFARVRNWITISDPLGTEELGTPGPEFFVLMSYDVVTDTTSVKLADRGKRLCAFEVFLFGPVTRPDGGKPWASLRAAYAVNQDGNMLQGVPLNIAQVSNYDKGAAAKEGDIIWPTVSVRGHGCFACHALKGEFPQTTLPFPWLGAP